MNKIPRDIYEHVHELALSIANASEASDEALYESQRQALRSYFDEQSAAGRAHPFLTEAAADHTPEAVEAVRLYELALRQAQTFPDEPTHTKKISLAERLIELGLREQAEACLRDGRAEAVRCGDNFWIEEADRLSVELGKA